jgi:phosphomannomutase
MQINPSIFKAYDIRGKYPDELNEEAAFKIGQGFVALTKAKQVIVGQDARLSSFALASALIGGINAQGAEVIDIGLCSTPCFYFSSGISKIPAIMVTASHAGKEFNGFKAVFGGNFPLLREQIIELKNLAIGNEFKILSKAGKITKKDFSEEYIKAIRNFIKEDLKPMKVVMDAGNGMAGLYIKRVFQGINISVVPIFFQPDGNFPNHEANPKIPANRQKLIEKILVEKADLGVMFDGDGDRVYFFDRNGAVIDPNLVSALQSQYLILNSTRKKVIIETRTSQIVKEWVEAAGGEVQRTVCWTIPIKLKMWQNDDFIFGSETSGHYVFSDFYKTDDGTLATVTFLNAIAKRKESIDAIIYDFRQNYFIIEETNFKISGQEKTNEILDKMEERYKKDGAKIFKIDGLSVLFPEWWFNLRVSETEPLIRLNLEAKSQKLMDEKKEEISQLILDELKK